MVVFSRITASIVLAGALLAQASTIQPKPALAARAQHRAQARNSHSTDPRSAKRAAAKKRVCSPKTSSSAVSTTHSSTTSHVTTTTQSHTTTKHTTTTSKKPAATKVSSGGTGSSSGGKLGLAWNDGPSSFMKPFIDGGADWCVCHKGIANAIADLG